jgi:hypothetical protein
MGTIRDRHPYKRDPTMFPPIKPDHAQAIGYVAAHWSLVEESLTVVIGFLLRLPQTVREALTAEINTLNRTLIISALLEVGADQELLDEWHLLRREFDDLRVRRNDVVHAAWRVVEPGHYSKRIKARSKFKVEFKPVATEELAKLSKEIVEFADKMVSLISGIIFSNVPERLADHLVAVPGTPMIPRRQEGQSL